MQKSNTVVDLPSPGSPNTITTLRSSTRRIIPPKTISCASECILGKIDSFICYGIADIDEAVNVVSPVEKKKQVGERLKQTRLEHGLTLKGLSALIGLSYSQISLIENGEYMLNEKKAADIATVLHVGIEWLLYGDEKKKEHPVDQTMIEWLWNHPEIRKEIWEQIIQTM